MIVINTHLSSVNQFRQHKKCYLTPINQISRGKVQGCLAGTNWILTGHSQKFQFTLLSKTSHTRHTTLYK